MIAVLFGTPTLLEGTPRFGHSYRSGGIIDFISRQGHITSNWSDLGLLSMYQNWPNAFIFGSIIHQLANIDILDLLMFAPMISQILYFFPLYIIFSNALRKRFAVFCAISMFFAMNWVGQDYFSAQNIGLLILLYFIALFIKIVSDDVNRKYLFVLIIFGTALILTHALSSLAALLYLISPVVILLILHRIGIKDVKCSRSVKISLLAVMCLVLISWSLYGTADYMFTKGVTRAIDIDIYNILHHYEASKDLGMGSNDIQNLLTKLKICVAGLFSSLGLLGFIYFLYMNKFCIRKVTMMELCFLSIILSNIALYASSLYGNEALIRAFLFSLVSLCFFSAILVNGKKTIYLIIIVFIVAFPMHIQLHYSNEKCEYYPLSFIESNKFLFAHSVENSMILGMDLLDAYRDYDKYDHQNLGFQREENGKYPFENALGGSQRIYATVSETYVNKAARYYEQGDINEYIDVLSSQYHRCYDNLGSQIYTR